MKYGLLCLLSLFIIVSLIFPSSAATKSISYYSTQPFTKTDWDYTHNLPLFDSSLGTLKSVVITMKLNSTMNGTATNNGETWANY